MDHPEKKKKLLQQAFTKVERDAISPS